MCQFLHQCNIVLVIVALQYSLRSGRVIVFALFFFLKTVLAIWGHLGFHINFKIIKIKNWFFKNLSKTDKPFLRLIKGKERVHK